MEEAFVWYDKTTRCHELQYRILNRTATWISNLKYRIMFLRGQQLLRYSRNFPYTHEKEKKKDGPLSA